MDATSGFNASAQSDVNRRLRRWHMLSALLVGTFLVAHLANHALLGRGAAAHIAAMEALRAVYRHPAVELVLLAAVSFQLGSGAVMLWRGRRQRITAWARLQAWSGAGLLLFIANHVAAVIAGRSLYGLDTNVHFAVAGMQLDGWRSFFIPYYFLGVALLGTHLACMLHWHLGGRMQRLVPPLVIAASIIFAGWIVLRMTQMPAVPPIYLATFP